MARSNGAPEFLRRNAATDLGKPDYAVDLDEQRIEPQFGPDEYGKRHSQVERDLIAGIDKLTGEIRRDPLREIATKTKALTYGEMMEYVAEIMGGEAYKAPTTAYEFAGMMDAWCKRTLSQHGTSS